MSEQQPSETSKTSVTTHEGPHGQVAGGGSPPESTGSAPTKRGLRRRAGGSPRTRISVAWVGALAGLLVLVLLLVFILENTEAVTVNFLGASGRLGLGLALLVAAVAGGLIVAILGVARMAQLRKLGKHRGAS